MKSRVATQKPDAGQLFRELVASPNHNFLTVRVWELIQPWFDSWSPRLFIYIGGAFQFLVQPTKGHPASAYIALALRVLAYRVLTNNSFVLL